MTCDRVECMLAAYWPPCAGQAYTGATKFTYDNAPAVAVAPNGAIGVLWYRYGYDGATGFWNYNIYFAILDASGNLAYGPANLTNNTAWGPWGSASSPAFVSPRIAATDDNRFVLAWSRQDFTNGLNDIYYAVRDSGGNEVKAITNLTNDTAGYTDDYYFPALTRVSGNRALLALQRNGNSRGIYFAVLDSSGNTVQGLTKISNDVGAESNFQPDAVQLSDGKTILAWSGGSYPNYTTRFAVLDASYTRAAGPISLSNPAYTGGLGDYYVSVAADDAGHAILTWTDMGYANRRNLYYALVDGVGNVLTQPMIFRSVQSSGAYIDTSFEGCGNTSYSPWRLYLPAIFNNS